MPSLLVTVLAGISAATTDARTPRAITQQGTVGKVKKQEKEKWASQDEGA